MLLGWIKYEIRYFIFDFVLLFNLLLKAICNSDCFVNFCIIKDYVFAKYLSTIHCEFFSLWYDHFVFGFGFFESLRKSDSYFFIFSILSMFIFVLCVLIFVVITILTRASGPRVRLEQFSILTWKNLIYMILFSIFFIIILFIL